MQKLFTPHSFSPSFTVGKKQNKHIGKKQIQKYERLLNTNVVVENNENKTPITAIKTYNATLGRGIDTA